MAESTGFERNDWGEHPFHLVDGMVGDPRVRDGDPSPIPYADYDSEAAKLRPQMWLGELCDAHIKAAVGNPCWVLWRLRLFAAPVKLQVTVSPHQLEVVAHTGPLLDSVASRFDWHRFDVLIDEIWRVGSKLRQEARDGPWWSDYREKLHFGILAAPVLFSSQGAIAIADEANSWRLSIRRYFLGSPIAWRLFGNRSPITPNA
jgi:hypothetical protein